MKESNLLKLEDLLPHFSDKVSVEVVQEDIVNALEEYKQGIEESKEELEELHHNAETVKADILELKQRAVEISTSQMCSCKNLLLKSDFIMFPCGHGFHKQCLFDSLLHSFKKKDKVKANKLVDYQNQLEFLNKEAQAKYDI